MTGKLSDQGLNNLERRFQALRDQIGAMPEACRPELEGALRELSQAIAVLRADREAGESPRPDPPGGRATPPGQCETILHHVFSAIPDLLTVHDRDFNVIMSNWHGYESLSEAERRGQPKCYRVYHHRDRPCEDCHALEVVATGQPLKVTKVNPVDGRVREVSAYPVRDESGRVVLVAEHVRDITDRHLAEQALKESEGRFRSLIEDSPESQFLTDVQGTVLASSRVAAERIGKELPEVMGRSAFEYLPPEVAARRWALFEQVIATGRPVRFEDVRGDRHFDINFNPILDKGGKVSRMSIMAIDITDRKNAEQALKESEATLRTVIEANPESLFLLDTRGVILAASRIAAQRLDKSLEEIIGADAFALVPTEIGQKRFEIFQQVVATGGPMRFEDVRGDFHLDISMTPIFSKDKVVQVAVLGVDLSLRKLAEAALRESEQRFRDIAENAAEWVWEVDPQGKYTYSSPVVEQLLGYKPEEILGKYFFDFFLPEEREEMKNAALAAFAAKQPFRDFLNPNLHKDGRTVQLLTSGIPILDERGNLLGYRGADIDITARKQAEAALAAHLQFLQLLLDTIPNPIFFKDGQGAYLGCNKAFEDYLGVTRQEIVGKSVYDLSPKELADEYHRMDLEAFQAAGTQVYESRVQAPDGARRHVVFHKATFPDPNGGMGGLVGIITDITGLKQAETELRESEQRFRLMAETIQDVFWISTSGIGKTVYVSPAYEHIWGRPCEPLYRNPKLFMEAIHPEDQERVRSEIAAAQAQTLPWSQEYRIIRPDGAVRWIQDRGFPIRDDQGRVIMFTGVATDITGRKALEGQLLQAQKMEAVGRLAGGVAHDFNNLLMAITGYGELMRAKVLKDDPLYGYLENILKAGDRAAALTQQLLTFSRQKVVQPQVIDLNRVVLDLEPMLRRLIGEDLDLEVVTDRRLGAVKADPGQMGQVIMNLVVNARDAMPQGGRLTLKTAPVNFTVGHHSKFRLAPPGPYVRLEVQDTGVGMDEAIQAHIFEPFFTTKEPGKGTGLGLSTVYGIVKQSGGYLDLASEPGAGSTFTIYLPRLEAIVAPPKPRIPITASFQGEETVLLVEDEDVLRGLLAKFLRLYGYTVLEARHGGEALLTCERHQGPIHVMVTDVVMPQMSGRELAARLTPLRPEMKVIYMSGYTEDTLIQHGVADLPVAFLQKPFKPIELARRVYAVLHSPVSQ